MEGKTIWISDAEYPLMEYIWDHAPLSAIELTVYALEHLGWKKNTTYTVLKRLLERGAIDRAEPHFIVRPLITREQVRRSDVDELVRKRFNDSARTFLASFLARESISDDELDELVQMVKEQKKRD